MTNQKSIRWLVISSFLIVAWFIIASLTGPQFGNLSKVSTNNQADFLPSNAESTKVQNLENNFYSSSSIPAVIVSVEGQGVTKPELNQYKILASKLSQVSGVTKGYGSVVGPIVSSDRKAVEIIVQIGTDNKSSNTIKSMRATVSRYQPTNSQSYVTGPAGLGADLTSAFNGIDSTLLYVTLIAVLVILLIVYRSLVLPFLVLLTSAFALSAAGFVIYHGVHLNWFKLNGQSQGILSILVIGATTDYSLLITSRFRESLAHSETKLEAIKTAYMNSFKPVLASGTTVILALLCLLLSDLDSNKSLGPVAALGIAFSLITALTFLPAGLYLFGRKAFWPFMPKHNPEQILKVKNGLEDRSGIWKRIPEFIAKRPRTIWVTCTIVLGLAVIALPSFKASGVSETQTILGKSQAVSGQTVLSQHFAAGSGSPVIIISKENNLRQVISLTKQQSGISNVYPLFARGTKIPLNVSGDVLVNATLSVSADSSAARNIVSSLRAKLHALNRNILVGGSTAIQIDVNKTSQNDLHKIIPVVLAVILVILIILLESIVAPVLLILSVILSFSATIGISALLFNHIFHFPGADAAIPLFGFIFLVALGIDYNIFLMTRIKEETISLGTKAAILRGLSVTGSVITSAGIVLAVTFAALSVVPILFLLQIAFIVAFGVLLDTIVVRSLLVPALAFDIGKYIWWPRKTKP